MGDSKTYDRSAWTDRFKKPTMDRLRDGLSKSGKPLFDAVRKRLLELTGVKENLTWYGDSWHWVVEYRVKNAGQPLAVVVPCPEDLQLAVHLDREFVQSLPVQRMKRGIRDGLELAQEPFDTRWGVWSLGGVSMLDDLQDLVEMKLTHTSKRAG